MRDLFFSRYHLDNEVECSEFVGALRALLEQVPLIVDVPGLLTRLSLVWRMEPGVYRRALGLDRRNSGCSLPAGCNHLNH